MIWQSYENQNIVLDEPMAEQLGLYLENKESQLSSRILETILQLEGLPSLTESASSSIRLSEAVEEFGKRINRAGKAPIAAFRKEKWKLASKLVNQALWNYLEVLEGCVIELFQQIDQIGFEQWNVDIVRAATSIKDELTHRMDDLIWAIRRLEHQLKRYRELCEKREGKWARFRKVFFVFSSLLDRSLEPTVRKCNKFLNFRYRKFIERYTGYLQLFESSKQSMKKVYNFRVLCSMDLNHQDKFKRLCFLLSLWEDNRKARVLPLTEPVRAIRSCITFENAMTLFNDYFIFIRNAIFDKSRMIKRQLRLAFIDKELKQPLVDNIAAYRVELCQLKEIIANYKKFHLQTDPGSRNWFKKLFFFDSEQQQKSFHELNHLSHEIKGLESLAAGFQASLEAESSLEKELTPELQNEINRHLHEMGQPLASKDLMRRNAKGLLTLLKSLDELASFDSQVVNVISKTLSKAMCSDWKYHVLEGIPLFHQIYAVHQGICSLSEDRQHLNRLHKFQRILNQLDGWIKNDETLKRAQQIDLDIHDIKAYLQDFLAYVQHLEPESNQVLESEKFDRPAGKAAQALLEYLNLFGNFFAKLYPDNPEHRMVRKQLLFIDQYFEAIDRRIQELNP